MKVYIAAPWVEKEGKATEAAKALEGAGHDITARWIARDVGQPPYQEALDDLDDIDASDALILLNTQARGQETSGKAVEFGYAIDTHMADRPLRLVVVGPATNVFHRLPRVIRVDTIEEAIDVLGR